MRRSSLVPSISVVTWLAWSCEAAVQGPMITLNETSRWRLEAISFFLFVVLLAAFAFQGVWNALSADFPRWPRVAFKKALGLMVLWGLLVTAMFTMASGVWRLLRPGASAKEGFPYRDPVDELVRSELPLLKLWEIRRGRLVRLFEILSSFARTHEGAFPPDPFDPSLPADTWTLADPSGMRYLYLPGRRLGEIGAILAYEPGLYGDSRFVLLADGRVELQDLEQIRVALQAEGR